MPDKEYPLNMAQIKADLFLAKASVEEARRRTPKAAKYIKGQAAYHLQQAAEKLIKIQIYHSNSPIDMKKIYKHSINDLIIYANDLGVTLMIPEYVSKNRLQISSWEAEGRYDVHMVVKITQLEKCLYEIEEWINELESSSYR